MANLQAEIELTVELRAFFNIDLFVQGHYQIRTGVKFTPKTQAATKIELKSELPPCIDDPTERQQYPACIYHEWGVSKTFLIIYKNEEVELDDQFNFKLSVIVDAQNITDCFNRMDMQLCFELFFTEKDYSPEKIETMQSLCSRHFKLHFNPRLGLHAHVPVVFDYFHLSAVTTTVHASLLCLIPPYVFDRPNTHRTSLFGFLFNQDVLQATTNELKPELLDRAYQLHNTICEILLSSYESLQDFYEKLIEHLPSNAEKPKHYHQNCRQKLRELLEKLKTTDDIHAIDNLAHAHIAQCSAENIMLWCQFIESFGFHEIAATVLSKDYHCKRVKRLSEGFFLRETSRINLLINESDIPNGLHELVRNSSYYSRLPHLPIECVEIDGTSDTLPILIEEIYTPSEERAAANMPTFGSKTSRDNVLLQSAQNLNKAQSNANFNINRQLTETRSTSTSSSSSSLQQTRSSLGKNDSPKVDRKPSNQHNSVNKATVFRAHSIKNDNPIATASDKSSVLLTSFRKVSDDKSLISSTVPSSTNPSFGLFPNQSDTDINLKYHAKHSPTATSHHSLPDVALERSSSESTTRISRSDSPVVLSFLNSTSDKHDDEVFSTTDQNDIVTASTFGDSSTKSKVLRASYRGKAKTMDRQMSKSNTVRSFSTSSATNTSAKHTTSNTHPKYLITKTDDNCASGNDGPVNYSLDSVLNLTLQLEQTSTIELQRRHTLGANDIHPVLVNGLNDGTTQQDLLTTSSDGNSSIRILDNDNNMDQSLNLEDNKQKSLLEYDRLHNNSFNSQTIEFVVNKEKLKELLHEKYSSNLMFYSDLSNPVSTIPYFSSLCVPYESKGAHLIVCVHGLDGNSSDLRLMKTYLELCLPTTELSFLMSSSNHSSTFDDIDVMVKQLIEEIDTYIERYDIKPQRISFIGHSLGNLIVRAAVGHSDFAKYRKLLYTYLSLSGPHLGTLFNTSGLVNMGMWLMQKWKKSCSLSQMSFSDNSDPKKTYLYQLSKQPCLEFFKNILLVASPQDRYVPFHSARIELCKAALKDTSYGSIYVEMITNLLEPIVRNPSITFVRYSAFHNIPSGTNNFIGRAAHIAILDSELFVEKLVLVSAAKYFK